MSQPAESRIDPTHFMERVAAEVKRQSSMEFANTRNSVPDRIYSNFVASLSPAISDVLDSVSPNGIKLTLPILDIGVDKPIVRPLADGSYELRDLLCHQDRDFVHVAYLALLGRSPDDGGFDTYLRLLRSGSSKIEILGYLHESPEGRLSGRRIRGLPLRSFAAKLARVPVIGIISRLLAALHNRDDAEREQRILDGYILFQLEKAEKVAASSQQLVNRALSDLESAYARLAAYASRKPGYDHVAQVATTAQSACRAVSALHVLVDRKANYVETMRALREATDSIRSLEHRKADAIEVIRLEERANELSTAINTLTSDKVNSDAVQELNRDLVAQLEAKATRSEVSREIQVFHEILTRQIESLSASKADVTTFNDAHEILTASLLAKADRQEITDLTSHLLDLIKRRSTFERVTQVESQLNAKIRNLSNQKADRESVDSATKELRGAVEALSLGASSSVDSVRELEERMEILAKVKIDKATLDSALEESKAILDREITSAASQKVDQTTFEARIAEMRLEIRAIGAHAREASNVAHDQLHGTIRDLLISKVDRSLFDNAIAQTHAAIDQLYQNCSIADDVSLRDPVPMVTDRNPDAIDAADPGRDVARALVEELRSEFTCRLDDVRRSLKEHLEVIAKSMPDHGALNSVRADHIRLNAQTRDLKRNLLDQERRLKLLLEEARKRLPQPMGREQLEAMQLEEDHMMDAMYASFEDIFRGTREDIKQRQSIYLPYVRGVQAGHSSTPIIDIGCGRGEWLEVLREAGLHGRGVDINRVFLAGCREIHLDVVEADGVAFLRSLAENSVGAVTSFHLLEHLEQKTLIALFDAALHVLRPGGIAIFETPNPRNLQVGSHTFYIDPTHRRPLPLELVQYLMEARGFGEIEIKELHPPSAENRITEGGPMINDVLNRLLFSAQDYAVIGRKS